MDRKGFLFTVSIFLVLTYILLSISVWVKSIEASERSFSEFYKESTVELAIDQITQPKLDNVSYIMMNRALLRLNDHSIDNPVLAGPEGDQGKNIREALRELVVDGAAKDSHFQGAGIYSQTENSSLRAWAANLNDSLRSIGSYIDGFEVTDFTTGQTSADKLDYSFDITLSMRDYTNTSSVSRTYHISNQVRLSGLVDPALARASKNSKAGDTKTIYRQFFFNPADFPETSWVAVTPLSSGSEGQGWLYGPLALASDIPDMPKDLPGYSQVAPSMRSSYILVGTYDEIAALKPDIYGQFGGFIVTTAPSHDPSSQCPQSEQGTFNALRFSGKKDCSDVTIDSSAGDKIDKPFIVARDFKPGNAPSCPILKDEQTKGRCVLFINKYNADEVGPPTPQKKLSPGGIYDVEKIRDFVMCGYYTKSPKAPSYMQRLLADSYSYNDSKYGIETFVIGNYANDYKIYDTNSRLDRELFNDSIEGIKIRGLPGCRDLNSCADTPITGIFAVGPDTMTDYGLGSIACNTDAGCDG